MGEQPSTEMDKQEHNETSRVANAIQMISFCEPNFFSGEARLLPGGTFTWLYGGDFCRQQKPETSRSPFLIF